MSDPRIYTYKITFPHQKWFYFGAHKENKFKEYYVGSPVTHATKWEYFYFEKQILEVFETWEEAREVENRLIKPYLDDPYCLNEHCGSFISTAALKQGGAITGKKLAAEGRLPKKKGKKVIVETVDGLYKFDTQQQAANFLGCGKSFISSVLNNNKNATHFKAYYQTT